MNPDYWLKRWVENRIGFHRPGTNPLLERFLTRAAPGPCRTLVPLCGKSADLIWLMSRGHDVVGVDLSDIAARSFSSEQGLALTVVTEPPFTVFRGERIAFYVGDFFNLAPKQIGRFPLIYDRAALIALPADLRPAYVRQLLSLLEFTGDILLISLEYDPSQMDGPPYSVPESEVRILFAECTIDKLHETDCLEEEPRFKERGVEWMKEVVYKIGAVGI